MNVKTTDFGCDYDNLKPFERFNNVYKITPRSHFNILI
jgi:hypothetical protein